jgi:preprotein translocase subunit Sec61beta
MILLLTVGAGAAVAGIMRLAARRWPQVEAPRVSGETIVDEVKRHPGLAGHLRHHFNPKTETGIALTISVALVIGAAVGIGIMLAMIRSR